MTGLALRFAREAEDLVGSPFRLHGRDPVHGLDCVGVALLALRRCGIGVPDIGGYALRLGEPDRFIPRAEGYGFEPAYGSLLAGDLVILRPSACQLHVAIVSIAGGMIHAHAGLGRVVHQAAAGDWPLQSHWRLGAELETSWQP